MEEGRFDELFMTLASQHDSVSSLLKTVFSFMHRKTDFYVVDENPRRPMGFAPGDAEKILLGCFRSLPYKGPDGRPLTTRPAAGDSTRKVLNDAPTATAAKREGAAGASAASTAAVKAPQQPAAAVPAKISSALADKQPSVAHAAAPSGSDGGQPAGVAATAGASPSTASAVGGSGGSASTTTTSSSPYTIIQYTPEGKQVPCSNGGVGPGYWWSQSLTDLTLHVALPADTPSKAVQCMVLPGKLKLAIKGAPVPIIDGPLYAAVRATEALWNLEATPDTVRRPVDIRPGAPRAPQGSGAVDVEPDEVLGAAGGTGGSKPSAKLRLFTLTLDKVVHTWWLRPIASEGHPEIDGTQVDSTQKIDSYDEETQAAIRKVMWDQSQKVQGLPTSEELEQARLLEMARYAPGSPFLPGQPLEGQPLEVAGPPQGTQGPEAQ